MVFVTPVTSKMSLHRQGGLSAAHIRNSWRIPGLFNSRNPRLQLILGRRVLVIAVDEGSRRFGRIDHAGNERAVQACVHADVLRSLAEHRHAIYEFVRRFSRLRHLPMGRCFSVCHVKDRPHRVGRKRPGLCDRSPARPICHRTASLRAIDEENRG